jgi:hypothetical protein
MMYPPRVSSAEVRALIQQLTVGKALPSGASVRTALKERFGSRGGVARIYRLLAEERVRLTPTPVAGSVEALQREIEVLRGRLARVEEREYAHQTLWAEEVDQLRLKLAAVEPLVKEARIWSSSGELLRYRLQAAERRAAMLEQQLYELAQGQGSPVRPEASAADSTTAVQSTGPA